MRKISQAAVRDDFRAQLADIRSFHNKGLTAFTSSAEESTLTEHTLLATAVSWEGFVSDMFIALINNDATSFLAQINNSFVTHINASSMPKRVFNTFGSLTYPPHLSKEQVQSLANGIGNNVTFSNYADLDQKARQWLSPAHAPLFQGIRGPQKAVVDATIALRNHVAHRSNRSKAAMDAAVAVPALHTTGLKRQANKFSNVGAWLKAVPPGKRDTRLTLLIDCLDGIAARF